jgi:hypothetical protein
MARKSVERKSMTKKSLKRNLKSKGFRKSKGTMKRFRPQRSSYCMKCICQSCRPNKFDKGQILKRKSGYKSKPNVDL